MKRGRKWGEGWPVAAALALLLALSLALWMNRQPRTQSAAPVHFVSMEELVRAATVDINHADAAKLQELPGIGPVLAAAIVEYREAHGPFDCAEDLMNVPGIGEGKLEGMRHFLRIEKEGS